jgi:hypothetical protein
MRLGLLALPPRLNLDELFPAHAISRSLERFFCTCRHWASEEIPVLYIACPQPIYFCLSRVCSRIRMNVSLFLKAVDFVAMECSSALQVKGRTNAQRRRRMSPTPPSGPTSLFAHGLV